MSSSLIAIRSGCCAAESVRSVARLLISPARLLPGVNTCHDAAEVVALASETGIATPGEDD
jgi:hypothetical protein